MQTVQLAEIKTPKGLRLDGIWFGPKKAKRVVILVHGLGGHMLNPVAHSISASLVTDDTAVLTFNTRGAGIVSKVYKDAPKIKKGYTRIIAGSAHEIFEDCVDDIEGAVRYVRKHGAREVYLAGHSTGCQKSIYWASKTNGAGVNGIILLAPISDYAGMKMTVGDKALRNARVYAQRMVKSKKGHELLPPSIWPETVDAQRFLSLYSTTGKEEIFTYWDSNRNPKTLRSVELPILVILAESDEYADRPVEELEQWFMQHIYTGEVAVIPGVAHSFHGAMKKVGKRMASFMKEGYN